MKRAWILFFIWTGFSIWSSTVLGEEPVHSHDDPNIDHSEHEAQMDDMDLLDDMEIADDMDLMDDMDNWEEDHTSSSPHQAVKSHNMSTESAREIGLRVLLQELEDLSLNRENKMGHVSEVRRKFQIATKLRKFDDSRAEQALKDLIKENACEDRGEDDILCVKWVAETSLQEIGATADLKKLDASVPFKEQEKIIRKYTRQPYENDFAVHAIKKYLTEQAVVQPEFAVPLLVELFTRHPQTEIIARKYPRQANKGLERCFSADNPTRVWWGINLARYLGKSDFLGRVHDIAFKKKGNIDYANQAEVEEIQTMAIGFFRAFEQQALPYYRAVLYGDFAKGKEYIISGVRNPDNPELLALFKEYSAYLAENREFSTRFLEERLRQRIALMEATGQ